MDNLTTIPSRIMRRLSAASSRLRIFQWRTKVNKNLRDSLFGFRRNMKTDATAIRNETREFSINEMENAEPRPRVYRTVGITEARLRARNKQSWITSTRGWSDFLGRFTSSSKAQ